MIKNPRDIYGDGHGFRAVSQGGPKSSRLGPCRYFALCDNPATTTIDHPVLGAVPTCQRCYAKMEKLSCPR